MRQPYEVGQPIKYFHPKMFGVVVKGEIVKVTKKYVTVNIWWPSLMVHRMPIELVPLVELSEE